MILLIGKFNIRLIEQLEAKCMIYLQMKPSKKNHITTK